MDKTRFINLEKDQAIYFVNLKQRHDFFKVFTSGQSQIRLREVAIYQLYLARRRMFTGQSKSLKRL